MAQLPCIGLPWPPTKPPFGSCAIYFHYGVNILAKNYPPSYRSSGLLNATIFSVWQWRPMATVGKSQNDGTKKNVCSPGLLSFTCMQEEDYVWIMILWHVCVLRQCPNTSEMMRHNSWHVFLKYYAVLQFSSLISIATSVRMCSTCTRVQSWAMRGDGGRYG